MERELGRGAWGEEHGAWGEELGVLLAKSKKILIKNINPKLWLPFVFPEGMASPEELEIWKLGSEIGDDLFDIADMLADKKKFRFSEQLYGAAMSITNNIFYPVKY